MVKLRTLPGIYAALVIFITALVLMPAHSKETDDVSALLEAKRFDAALEKASAYVQKYPGDPQMRFLQGVSMASMGSMGRSADAITVFTALTTDFPDMAEAYNNLAVLHAAARNYDSARVALEKAIRADPAYATAHENLGELYLQLASQTYTKVVQLAPDNAGAKRRQALLASINAQPMEKAPFGAEQKTMASGASAEKELVLAAVRAWADAWGRRDVPAYLNQYAADFQTPNREPRASWEQKRRTLIESKTKIVVTVDSPQVSFNDGVATVTYKQIYVSDNHTSKDRKTLVLRKGGSGWKIIEERVGS